MKKKTSKNLHNNADEVAKAMVENMKANMENLNYEDEHEIMADEVRKKIIANREKKKRG